MELEQSYLAGRHKVISLATTDSSGTAYAKAKTCDSSMRRMQEEENKMRWETTVHSLYGLQLRYVVA
jgi:hypothetical protein